MTETSWEPSAVHLPQHLAQDIISHARAGTPEEICGIVRGRGLQAFEIIRGHNIAEERIENYTVDPQTLLRQFDFEEAGDEMMGIYHSHPVSEAYPSATDAWNAYYPDAVYFICSLEKTSAPVIRAFHMLTKFFGAEAQPVLQALTFDEVRPGLFAYYQPARQVMPPTLSALVNAASSPLYVVYFTASPSQTHDQSQQVTEVRIVSIIEHPVIQT